MKLNLTPQEFLALHNALFERRSSKHEEPDDDADAINLRHVYNRIRAMLHTSMSIECVNDPIDSFLSREKKKIDMLNDESLSNGKVLHSDYLNKDDLSELPPEYPRSQIQRDKRRQSKK